jgi:hypothetical protein
MSNPILKTALATAVLVGCMLTSPQSASTQSLDQQTQQRIAAGYTATPVPLDLKGKDPLQVGMGSYIVNATGICNHCHSVNQYYKAVYPYNVADPVPYASYTGDPYFLAPPNGPYLGGIVNGKATFQIDTTTFVSGGQLFGATFPRSKNLTPNPNGNVANPTTKTPYYAEGGMDWKLYWGVLHNGVDIDQLVKACSGSVDVGTGPAGCIDPPANPYVLQVMPWPTIRQVTDNDLNAIWQYLSAIPCTTNLSNVNGPSGSNIANTYGGGVLINSCTPAVPADSYKFYQYVDGKVVPVPPAGAALVASRRVTAQNKRGSLVPVSAALLPAHSTDAQSISPPPAPSTPSCGLGKEDYPSCPTSFDDERIAQGFAIAPVPLNMTGRDPRKVGIGSYWMNSAGNCDGCHSSPTLGNNGQGGQFTTDGNPQNLPVNLGGNYAYASVINPYNPPAIVNADGYLSGGTNFGNPAAACDSAGGGGCGVYVIVRNLTPDFSTGKPMPEKNTLEHFIETLRTGHDFQNVHPNCPPVGPGGTYCLDAPSDGTKLQIMPWPALSNATDYDLESLYEYLSAIPCISNAGSPYPQIINTCPDNPQVKANYHKYAWVNGLVKRLD